VPQGRAAAVRLTYRSPVGRDYLDPLAVFAAFGNAPAPGAHTS
jgi:hypothetical protein